MRRFVSFNLAIALLVFVPQIAQAFPEMIRHGYVNCNTCHISPTGGGSLSNYGRALSEEVLSTFQSEGEGEFLYGAIKLPEWLNIGGDYRLAQIRQDNSSQLKAAFFVMQAENEVAVKVGNVTADVGVGFYRYGIESRQHYLMYQPNNNFSLRAGRFYHSYGLRLPDHFVSIKRGLNWDQGSETYNFEMAYMGESFYFFYNQIFGRLDKPDTISESGVTFSTGFTIGESSRLGLSYYLGSSDIQVRHVVGPNFVIGFTPYLSLMGELDLQSIPQTTNVETYYTLGFVDMLKLDWEPFQGFHLFLTQELTRLNFNNATDVTGVYGIGLQWFPRPHFDIQMSWQKKTEEAFPNEFTDYAYITAHFYL